MINLKKNKILILGATGTLGHTLLHNLSTYKENLVYGTVRNKKEFYKDDKKIIDKCDVNNLDKFYKVIKKIKPDYVINCIGFIKQKTKKNDIEKILLINSIFPKKLSIFCKILNIKFIHVSTDCVFDGKKGNYSEDDDTSANDLYGISKYLGEINDNYSLTIRTSIIGHEVNSKKNLLEWVISKNNYEIDGYINAIFSGLTTLELSKIIHKYVFNAKLSGIYHIASRPINKYDLIKIIIKVYKLNIKLKKNHKFKIDRTLNDKKFKKITNYRHNSWQTMIKELKENNDNQLSVINK